MSQRILRVNQLIRRELSQIILREIEFPAGVLVTVTRVESSPNLNEAKVYISCLPEEHGCKVLRILSSQVYNIQQELNRKLKMKVVPRIQFVEEVKTKEAGKIEELLEEIKKRRVEKNKKK